MRRLGTLSRPDRPTLGSVAVLTLAAALLAGCGDDPGAARDPATPEPSSTTVSPQATPPVSPPDDGGSTPSADPSAESVESDEVAILSETAAGGSVSTQGVALKDDTAVQEFAGQFSDGKLGDEISSVVARTDVPVGKMLYGAVVAVGCDVPPGVVVSSSDDGVTITAQKVTAPKVECFAPVTSVGLVLVAD